MLQTAKIFQDGMILQRGKRICVWGQSEPETTVTVEIQGQKESTIAKENGEWSVWILKLKASEDEVMHISTETEHLQYKDVAVGEVWVAGGQSILRQFFHSLFFVLLITHPELHIRLAAGNPYFTNCNIFILQMLCLCGNMHHFIFGCF